MNKKRSKAVFISGPLTCGLTSRNIRRATEVGVKLREAGYIPIVPHCGWFSELMHPHNEEFWLQWDFAMMSLCDTVLRLKGKSPGGDREVQEAEQLKKRILFEEKGGLACLLREAKEKELFEVGDRVASIHTQVVGTIREVCENGGYRVEWPGGFESVVEGSYISAKTVLEDAMLFGGYDATPKKKGSK